MAPNDSRYIEDTGVLTSPNGAPIEVIPLSQLSLTDPDQTYLSVTGEPRESTLRSQ